MSKRTLVVALWLGLASLIGAQTLSPEPAAALEEYLAPVRDSAMVTNRLRAIAIDSQASLSAAEKAAAKSELPRIAEVIARESDRYLSDPKLIPEMKEVTMNVMAKHFTAEEIREITAFYQTSIGTQRVAERPQIMTEAMQASMQLTGQTLGSMIETMTRELLAKPTLAPAK